MKCHFKWEKTKKTSPALQVPNEQKKDITTKDRSNNGDLLFFFELMVNLKFTTLYPIGSMYGISSYI